MHLESSRPRFVPNTLLYILYWRCARQQVGHQAKVSAGRGYSMKAGVKKVYIKAIVKDDFDGAIIKSHKDLVTLSEYREEHIKHESIDDGYTFSFLVDSAEQFARGIYYIVRGALGVSRWTFVLAWEGIRWLFRYAFGDNDRKNNNIKSNGRQ